MNNKYAGNTGPQKLGLDFNGVISRSKFNPTGDAKVWHERIEMEPLPNAFETIAALSDVFQGLVWIVSKAGPVMEKNSRRMLEESGFWTRTGIPRNNIRFCLTRPEKLPISVELGLTHFVDDHVHVLQILKGHIPKLHLLGNREKHISAHRWAVLENDWPALMPHILRSAAEFNQRSRTK